MRPVIQAPPAKLRIHLAPPFSSSTVVVPPPPSNQTKCDAHTSCPWWPYSNSKDFKANTATIVAILFCTLISGLAFNAAIRYLLRRRRRPPGPIETQRVEAAQGPKPSLCLSAEQVAALPTVVFSAGMKLQAAERSECSICLSEFIDGEEIRVLAGCNHGFHVQCIHQWLSAHTSCPNCRASCLPPSSSFHCDIGNIGTGLANFPPSAATESQRGPQLLLSTL